MTTKALRKQLVAAIAMVLVAAVALGSSTYAWFSLNTEVSAEGMQVKAVAEQGLLINEVATANDTNWDNQGLAGQNAPVSLRATSTANTGTWYVAFSKLSDNSASATSGNASGNLTDAGYTALGTSPFTTTTNTVTATAGSKAQEDIVYVDTDEGSDYDDGEGFYVKYTYYLKSSAAQINCGTAANAQNLQIKEVTCTQPGTVTSGDLDKSLRVAVVVNSKAYIYAPVSGATGSYYVNASATATTPLSGAQATDLSVIPASDQSGTPVYVYVYFEGEDTNLKTSNALNTLDTLTVDVKFELKTLTAAATVNGVSIS